MQLAKNALTFFISLSLCGNLSLYASDYCGQPVPQDIASEGFKRTDGGSVEHPFGDPGSTWSGSSSSQNQLSGRIIFVPPGATIPLYLDRPLGSSLNRMGDTAYAYVADGSTYGIPSGTVAELVILMVEPASRGFAKPGRMQIGVNRLILQNGQSVWMRGLVVDNKGDSRLQSQRRGARVINTAGKIALGAGVGAASGALAGAAIGNGNTGTGAIIGTAIGAVVGGIWAATVKGKDVFLPQGMTVLLTVKEGTQAYY
jgi:hypothetical protein